MIAFCLLVLLGLYLYRGGEEEEEPEEEGGAGWDPAQETGLAPELSWRPSRFLFMDTAEPKFGILSEVALGLESARDSSHLFLTALLGVAGVEGDGLTVLLSSVEQRAVVLDLEYTTGVRLAGTVGGGVLTRWTGGFSKVYS